MELEGSEKLKCFKKHLSLLVVNERVYPLYSGGMELATYHLVNTLKAQGWKVKILSAKESRIDVIGLPGFMEYLYTTNIRIVRFFLFLIFGFLKLLRRNREIDLLHGQPVFPSGLLAVIAGKLLQKPIILWARGADIYEHLENPFTRPIVKWTINRATRIIALTEDLKDRIQMHCKNTLISIIPNGVVLPKRTKFDRIKFFRKYGLPSNFKNKQIILFVGRLVPFKGIEYLINAMMEIIDRDPNIILIIIGDGKLKLKLKEISHKLGVNEHVIFVGQLPWIEVLKWLNLSVLFVYPTLRGQGMNNAVLEAMATGVPVITTNIGGLPSIIQNGETGILVSPRNSEAITREVLQVVSHPQDSKNMGIKAKKHVEKFHSWKKVSEKYSKVCISAYLDFYRLN